MWLPASRILVAHVLLVLHIVTPPRWQPQFNLYWVPRLQNLFSSRLQPHLSVKFYFSPGRYKIAAPSLRNDGYTTCGGFLRSSTRVPVMETPEAI